MKHTREFFVNTLVGGLLVVVPVYLAVMLLLKAMQSVAGLVRPVAKLLPPSLPAENLLSLLLVLSLCFLIGLAIRAPTGRAIRERMEKSLFERIPGYALIRSLTQRLAGESGENVWQPALAEIEDALVPAFIIEEVADGRLTVFVPSIPTPLAGAVYVLSRERVHPLDVPFTQAIQTVSRWGSGAKELVAAMPKPSLADAVGASSTGARRHARDSRTGTASCAPGALQEQERGIERESEESVACNLQKPQELMPIGARDKLTMGNVAAFDRKGSRAMKTYERGDDE